MKAVQIQKHRENSVDAKLDKIKELMEEVLVELKEDGGYYPLESQIKVSKLRKLNKMIRAVVTGKSKTVKFRNIQELDRIVSAYKA